VAIFYRLEERWDHPAGIALVATWLLPPLRHVLVIGLFGSLGGLLAVEKL
jgi:hypothetical protein